MEHKLVLGAGHYLPYARSRIRALRAAGLVYHTQRYLLADADIRVSLNGAHDYILIRPLGMPEMPMDSGVVDVLSIGPLAPTTYQAGILHETEYVGLYNQPFVLPDSMEPPRLNPGEGSAGQFSGIVTITGKTFKGHVPLDGEKAESFRPRQVADEAEPPNWTDSPDDEAVFLKKRAAVLCPASMFTGKTRLYAQALYGRHLYSGPNGDQMLQAPFELNDVESGERPALWLNNRRKNQQRVLLWTGCGVHLDAAGKHWLFSPGAASSSVVARRLVASTGVESLRKRLLDAELSAEDREHLEAYILADCLPDENSRQTVDMGAAVGQFSMGYSWHWNWTGTTADIVINEQRMLDGTYSEMVSTHHRMHMEMVEGQWACTTTVEEGPVPWRVYRAQWVITEPNWGEMRLEKTTPQHSIAMACDAPFYAYYERDSLVVCRVKVEETAAEVKYSTSPMYDSTPPIGPSGNGVTLGLLGGFRESETVGAGIDITVQIGGSVFGPVPFGTTSSGTRGEVKNKVWTGGWSAGLGSGSYGTRNFLYGYPDADGAWADETVTSFLDNLFERAGITYDHDASTFTTNTYGTVLVIVPFYDAEAVIVDANVVKEKATSTTTQHLQFLGSSSYGTWMNRSSVSFIDGVEGTSKEYIFFGYSGSGVAAGDTLLGTSSSSDSESDETLNQTKLMARGLAVEVDDIAPGPFIENTQDFVEAMPTCLTGTRLDGPVVIATNPDFAEGSTASSVAAPALVGWV